MTPPRRRAARRDQTQWLAELVTFVSEYDRWPALQGEPVREKPLANWALRVRAGRAATVTPEAITRVKALHAETLGRRESRRRTEAPRQYVSVRTDHRLAELEEFTKRHGRMPSRTAATVAERSTAAWVANVRARRTIVDDATVDRVKALAVQMRRPPADHRLAELEAFVARHGRMPRSAARTAAERSIAGWAWRVRDGRTPVADATADRVKALAVQMRRPPADHRLAELEAFVADHGRMPALAANDPAERSMAGWAWRIRKGKTATVSAATVDRVKALHAATPHTRRGRPRRPPSDHRLAELEQFIADHSRMPSTVADALAERSIAIWASSARAGRTSVSAATVDRVKALHAAAPARLGGATPGQTDHRLAELVEFVERTGRMPQTRGVVAKMYGGAERSLALWAAAARTGRTLVSPDVAKAITRLTTDTKTPRTSKSTTR